MRYLNFSEKEILAENVKRILSKFGGFWITSDISLKKILQQEYTVTQNNTKNLLKMTQLDFENNLFESEDHAKKFLEDFGFVVERHSFLEVIDQLSSPAKINMPKEKLWK